ncbi:MAG: csrA [Anaerosolibacter sp.]|jgi:carbon storage regulator|uniref:carbon storage regulator CsrA n=1 Tax=Anaerosolibacter sp. TaxID=1872527 RepID=UPI00261C6851|nr:carbon storage regulator CsrA [Anaerosolibacter sp.]MDF2546590.1 csrA [Anaerosolibacter sp.]
MLVLTRKHNESIIIDGQIEITVVASEEGKVKLGISAPKEINIYRKEVYDEIQAENKAAVSRSLDMIALKNLLKK